MNNKLLIGIIAVIVAFLIAGAILCGPEVLTFVNHLMLWIPLSLWIFLVWIVWKKKTSLFPDQVEPKLAKRLLKWLKVFLLVAGIPYAMFWGSVLWGSVIFDATADESALFLIPFSFALLFVMGFIGFLVIPVISLMKMTKLKAKVMSISNLKLRIISGPLLVLSGILGYFSRREVHVFSQPMSRIAIFPNNNQIYVYYIWVWELLVVAILFFVTASTVLIISFKKPAT